MKENNYTITNIDTSVKKLPIKGQSIIKIGDSNLGGTDIRIEVSTKFNWLQKKLWKYLLNIDIEDIGCTKCWTNAIKKVKKE